MKFYIALSFLFCMLAAPGILHAQAGDETIIQGSVTAKLSGEILVGVNVVEYDVNNRIVNATTTDFNGQFVLPVKNTDHRIEFSFIGFKKFSVVPGNDRTIDIELEEDVAELDVVEVTGTKIHNEGAFSIPQREITTAVQTISTKEFEGIQATSIDEALQGHIAGLDIVANSGDPGSGTSMRIRGTSSINANVEPLIVLNGIPYDVEIDPNFDFATANQEQYASMLSINPDDIEEITVLKDAASTAVWGSRGANGVLMIKTKKGITGPTQLQYTYRLTRAVQPQGLNMLNGDDYTMMMKQALFNVDQDENASDLDELNYDPSYADYENFNNNTDWVKRVSQVGYTHDHYLTVMGGGERARYRVSGGFFNQTGTVIGQELDRISSRVYLDYNVSNRLRFITEFSFTYSNNQQNWRNNENPESILAIAYRKMPNLSVYNQDLDGNRTDQFYNIPLTSSLDFGQVGLRNPVALARLAKNNLTNYRILPTFRLQYDLIRPEDQMLRYNAYVTFDLDNNKTSMFLPAEVSNNIWSDNVTNRADYADSENLTVQTDNNITWKPNLSDTDHSLLLYGSFQLRTGNSYSHGIVSYGLPSDEADEASTDAYLDNKWSSRFQWRSLGMLARMHYTFKDRYIVGATIRRDGSTKFGAGNKFGNFPGVSLKWIISDEPFLIPARSWLSMLAIRPSWGITGNQPGDEYLHFSRYGSYGRYIDINAVRPSSLKLTGLKWETTTSWNMGFDIAFFNDTYVFDVNLYHKRTEDLLFKDVSLPSTSGFGVYPWLNIGTMDNDGWEVNFIANQFIKANDFSVDFHFNIANNVNTIVEMKDEVLEGFNSDFNYANGSYLTRIQEGNSFGSIYGFRYKGVFQYDEYNEELGHTNAPVARDANGEVIVDQDGEALPLTFAYGESNEYEFRGGDAIYEDINHDGTIDELDIVYLGNSFPKASGGLGATFRYKGLSVTSFFNYRFGNKIVNAARMDAENMYTSNNQSIAVDWRWRKDGDVTEIPRALYQAGYNWLGSDRYVEDGSFVRFKYLRFNYTTPKRLIDKIGVDQLNLYLTINNLYVWTKYTGVDPEVGYGSLNVSLDRAQTPRAKSFTFGVSVRL